MRVVPTASVIGAVAIMTWRETGSIASAHWLPYALVVLFLLAMVLLWGAAIRPPALAAAAVAALVGLAASYVVAGGPGRAWAASLLQAVLPVAAAAPVAFSLLLQNAL